MWRRTAQCAAACSVRTQRSSSRKTRSSTQGSLFSIAQCPARSPRSGPGQAAGWSRRSGPRSGSRRRCGAHRRRRPRLPLLKNDLHARSQSPYEKLFLNYQGAPTSNRGLRNLVAKYLKVSGITKQISPPFPAPHVCHAESREGRLALPDQEVAGVREPQHDPTRRSPEQAEQPEGNGGQEPMSHDAFPPSTLPSTISEQARQAKAKRQAVLQAVWLTASANETAEAAIRDFLSYLLESLSALLLLLVRPRRGSRRTARR